MADVVRFATKRDGGREREHDSFFPDENGTRWTGPVSVEVDVRCPPPTVH